MCICNLIEGTHWYVDMKNASTMFLVACSPEQAEHSLLTWAGRTVRLGHQYLDIRSLAGRVLQASDLYMTAICDSNHANEIFFSHELEDKNHVS